ncbi:RluA family pseudouridine synthase [Sporosalibacterium faouarense]|uniref:RluA family pseudouridine synthase n=1 Tax=Sporosalibacterium faouarense TaxID=516123 RepID=UPI00141CD1F5|nr:RluA family pseudouridine synthase [Sporosalibacterium faouarense]MTI49832.1 RluA family pseudouridine synthase [Bacillota bacterium]
MNLKENESTLVYTVKSNNEKLEDVLKNDLDISGRLFRKLYKNKRILHNGEKANKKRAIKKDDVIVIIMEDEQHNYKPEKMKLDIIYEDNDLIFINKEPGVVVHSTKSHTSNTLANGIAYYFKEKSIKKKIRFVNRLDMDTSGIVIVAKNPFGHQQMSKQFDDDTVEKKYLVLVEGRVDEDIGVINEPIGKDKNDTIRNIVTEDGKPSITEYKAVQKFKNTSLLEAQIFTGRTHQIRVHMKYIGHPVIGDVLYNKPSTVIARQALHSYSLKFNSPRTGERLEVKASLPKDIQEAIDKLG